MNKDTTSYVASTTASGNWSWGSSARRSRARAAGDRERVEARPPPLRAPQARGRVEACYEAGVSGYGPLFRPGLGVACQVIAPALTPRRPGQRIKTDKRDARKLIRLFRAGELTAIRVPGTRSRRRTCDRAPGTRRSCWRKGLKWEALGVSHEDSQSSSPAASPSRRSLASLASRRHMIGGDITGLDDLQQRGDGNRCGYLKHSLGPWLARIESAVNLRASRRWSAASCTSSSCPIACSRPTRWDASKPTSSLWRRAF